MSIPQKLKTIFIGTGEFGLPCISALADDPLFELIAVISQPDKPAGRGMKITESPIKSFAAKRDIRVYQPEKIRLIETEIESLEPDLMIVASYAQLIPLEIITLAKFGCLNIHGSLLPKYRGAGVMHAPIINGEKESGVTIMKLDAGLDTGPILSQTVVVLEPEETAGSLFNKLSVAGAQLLIPTIKDYISGKLQPVPQDNIESSYVGKLKKTDAHINWGLKAGEAERFIRAMYPFPGAYSKVHHKNSDIYLKISSTDIETLPINNYCVGEVFEYEKWLAVQCGKDALKILLVQPQSKNTMTSKDYLLGHPEIIGKILK